MDKREEFVEKMDKRLDDMKVVADIMNNQNVDPDYVFFCNMLRDRKYEIRKIASKYPTSQQHQVAVDLVEMLYIDSGFKFTMDQRDSFPKLVEKHIGIGKSETIVLHLTIYSMLIFLPYTLWVGYKDAPKYLAELGYLKYAVVAFLYNAMHAVALLLLLMVAFFIFNWKLRLYRVKGG